MPIGEATFQPRDQDAPSTAYTQHPHSIIEHPFTPVLMPLLTSMAYIDQIDHDTAYSQNKWESLFAAGHEVTTQLRSTTMFTLHPVSQPVPH